MTAHNSQPHVVDPHSSSQAVSQGLYALAKLGHHPGEEVLDALAGMLPTLISSITVDRQAVGNSLWALANLGYPIPNTLYKQMIELVLQHCHRFMACHFDQVHSPPPPSTPL